jgi:hypothetical protein
MTGYKNMNQFYGNFDKFRGDIETGGSIKESPTYVTTTTEQMR